MDDLRLLSTTTEEYPLSGRSLHRYVFMSRRTGQVTPVDLDPAGKPRSEDEMRESERLARLARFGHLRPALAGRIANLPDGDKTWAVLYLPVEDRYGAAGSDLLSDPSLLAAEQARVRGEVDRGLQRLLDAMGPIEHVPAADGSPWVRAHLTVAQLRSLARTDLVGAIYDGEEQRLEPTVAQNADHYALSGFTVAHNTWGALGSGVRVADVLETVPEHANLPFNTYGSRAQYPMRSPCNENCDYHGSYVMGYIQNTNPHDQEMPALTTTGGKKGVAPLATMYSANGTEVMGTLVRADKFTVVPGTDGHTWTSVAAGTSTGSFSPNVLQALPDGLSGGSWSTGPRLDYTLGFPITGNYYIWVRGKCLAASCGSSDSVYVGLDGQIPSTAANVADFTSSYSWKSITYPGNARPYFNVATTGTHTINVYVREDGFTFDALMITPVSSWTPVDMPSVQRLAFTRDLGTHMDRYAWLATKNVLVANLSMAGTCDSTQCAQQDFKDQVADYYATHPPYILSVYGAGNYSSGGTYGNIVKHFLYNGLVIGGAQPRCYTPPVCNPRESFDRTLDHTVHNFVYQNPRIGTDWELPHMVAYGAGLHWSLTSFGESGGTSFATPQVTGTAALVIGNNAFLQGRPEAVKAIVMAGADVNTDLNSTGLGAAYSYLPRYNRLTTPSGVDRHGGVGLLNADASVEISRATRQFLPDNRVGVSNALVNVPAGVASYQAGVTPPQAPLATDFASGTHGGFDAGSMNPATDFDDIWWKHHYFFRPTVSGNLRVVVAWNRPFNCSGTPVTCGAEAHPTLNMLVRDLEFPTGAVAGQAVWEPNELFVVAPVVAGKVYRLDLYKQNTWNGPVSYGVAAYMTANPQ